METDFLFAGDTLHNRLGALPRHEAVAALRPHLRVHHGDHLHGDRGAAARLLQRVHQPRSVRVRVQGLQERLRQGRGPCQGGPEDDAAQGEHEGRGQHDPVHVGRELPQQRHQAEAPEKFRRLLQKIVGRQSLGRRGFFLIDEFPRKNLRFNNT